MLRLRLCKVADAIVEQLEGRLACCRLAKTFELFLLVLADDGELPDLCFGLLHHVLRDSHNAFGKRLAQPVGIKRVVVLHNNASRLYLDVYLELWNIELEQLLPYRVAVRAIL